MKLVVFMTVVLVLIGFGTFDGFEKIGKDLMRDSKKSYYQHVDKSYEDNLSVKIFYTVATPVYNEDPHVVIACIYGLYPAHGKEAQYLSRGHCIHKSDILLLRGCDISESIDADEHWNDRVERNVIHSVYCNGNDT